MVRLAIRTAPQSQPDFLRLSLGLASARNGIHPRSLPQPVEPATGDPSVVDRVLGITVAQLVLHGAEVDAGVGGVIAAGVPQHVKGAQQAYGR